MASPVVPDQIEMIPWDNLPKAMGWSQGEHVALVGPTGAGKTTAATSLVEQRRFVMLTSTKPQDPTLRMMRRHGWVTIDQWPPPPDVPRVILHAPLADLETDPPRVGATIRRAINGAYKATSWCVVLDDLQALNTTCGLQRITSTLLVNARSSRVSCVVGTQRPRWVPREVWTQCTHLFIWRCVDADDLRALSGLGSADTKAVRATVAALDWDRHECLYVNTRTGRLARTIPPPPPM